MGWCIQKKAHTQRLSDVKRKDESFVQDKKWWCGFFTHAGGNVLAKLSYAFGPASLLLPLDTLRIAFTTALASKYLDEKVGIKEIIGISIIILSAVISVFFGPRPVDAYYTIEGIAYRYEQTPFLIVAGLLTLVTLSDYILLKIESKLGFINYDQFNMISYIWIAAYFGAWNVLLVKCVLEVVASSFISKEIAKLNWTNWLSYINIIALVTTTISIEYWRQKALSRYHTGYVVAIYTVLQIVGGILLSSIFFQEFAMMETIQLVLFFVGVALSFVGVAVVAYDSEHHEQVKKQKTRRNIVSDDENKIEMTGNENGNVTVDYSSSDIENENENKNNRLGATTENERLVQ